MMYHHVKSDSCSNDYDIFEKHLEYISKNFSTTFPTDSLEKKSICLVFDDGYYDFYKFIFPLLKKYKLKALLAVVPKYILDKSDKSDDVRLNYPHDELFKEYKNATFCTYEELREMMSSGLVQVVSHSYSHVDLTHPDVLLQDELCKSKEVLEDKLGIKVESFVFPFGKYNKTVLNESKKYYKYNFRIGNAINKDFFGTNGVIYRIDADNLVNASDIFSFKNMLKFRFKRVIKSITGNNK